MKNTLLFFALSLILTYSLAENKPPAQVAAWYDNIDITSLLSNKRVWVPYSRCLLDQGKCSPEAKELKTAFKEALANHCKKCTEAQRATAQKVIKYFVDKEPETWRLLVEKYDPNKEYLVTIEEKLKKT